jgi:UDP-GlcNAc:undecaprenyl-phosphate/decaprenyl-phosphate GlcNAc-1-phosphate transferase
MTFIYLSCFAVALFLSFVLTRMVRNIAVNRQWLAVPSSDRHIHNSPVPRLGGIAIYTAFVTVTGGLILAAKIFHLETGLPLRTIAYLMAAGTIVFALGLWDDIRSVPPYLKIAVQSLAATLLYFHDFRIAQLKLVIGEYDVGFFALPLTILWILLITNAFNLIDGLDGLAAGSALFSTITVFVIAINGNLLVTILTITLAGSILGFLRFNFNPATIFLGDSGSLFIGFMLGALALVGSQKTSTIVAVAIPLVSFGLPILETAISIIRRFLNGQPLFAADREHIHHKLLERGFSQRQAVIILYGVSAVCGLLSLFLLAPGSGSTGIVLIVLGVGVWVGVQHLGYHEFFELGRIAQRTIEQKRMIVNNVAIRKAAMEMAKVKDYDELYEVLQRAFAANEFDGFRLIIVPEPLDRRKSWRGNEKLERQNELRYEWSKVMDESVKAPVWTLTLDLLSADRQQLGYFLVYRAYQSKSCLVDVNLLVSDFQSALVEAVARLLRAEERVQVLELSPVGFEAAAKQVLKSADELSFEQV